MNMYKENLDIGQYYSKCTVQCMFLVNKAIIWTSRVLVKICKRRQQQEQHLVNVSKGMIGVRWSQ